jgi:protein-L-isoaspartate O-methyltransferase
MTALALTCGSLLPAQKLAPYVSSPQPVVERMLDLARLKSGETLYDLGCGDGRILVSAAKSYGARAVGVELSATLAQRARQLVDKEGLQDRVQIIERDMRAVDVSAANVVALYLMTDANEQLRPKLERELRPGARVEKVQAHRHPYTIYLYDWPQK